MNTAVATMAPSTTPSDAMLPGQIFHQQTEAERNKRFALAKKSMGTDKDSKTARESITRVNDKGGIAKPTAQDHSTRRPSGSTPESGRKEKKKQNSSKPKPKPKPKPVGLENEKSKVHTTETDIATYIPPHAGRKDTALELKFDQDSALQVLQHASPTISYTSRLSQIDTNDLGDLEKELTRVTELIKLIKKEYSSFLLSRYLRSLEHEHEDLVSLRDILKRRQARIQNPDDVDSYATTLKLTRKFDWVCDDLHKMSRSDKGVIHDGMGKMNKRFDQDLTAIANKQNECQDEAESLAMKNQALVLKKLKQLTMATRHAATESRQMP